MQFDVDRWLAEAYASVFDGDALSRQINHLAEQYKSHVTALIYEGEQPRLLYMNGADESAMDAYPQYENKWVTLSMDRLLRGELIHGVEAISLKELKKTDYYNAVLKPNDIQHSLGFLAQADDGGCSAFTLSRTEKAGYYEPDELAMMRGLQPHLSSIINLHLQASEQTQTCQNLQALLNQRSHACMLVDERSKPVYVNPAAEQMLSEGRCIHLNPQGELCLRDPQSHAQFKKATNIGILNCDCWLPESPKGGRARIRMQRISQKWSVFQKPQPHYLIEITSVDASPQLSSEELKKLFGLTHAEAELVSALAQTYDLRAAAKKRFVSYETARSYLKNILRKTQTSNQGELLAVMAKIQQ